MIKIYNQEMANVVLLESLQFLLRRRMLENVYNFANQNNKHRFKLNLGDFS